MGIVHDAQHQCYEILNSQLNVKRYHLQALVQQGARQCEVGHRGNALHRQVLIANFVAPVHALDQGAFFTLVQQCCHLVGIEMAPAGDQLAIGCFQLIGVHDAFVMIFD